MSRIDSRDLHLFEFTLSKKVFGSEKRSQIGNVDTVLQVNRYVVELTPFSSILDCHLCHRGRRGREGGEAREGGRRGEGGREAREGGRRGEGGRKAREGEERMREMWLNSG